MGGGHRAAFGTDVVLECMKVIVEKGELQLTAAERKEKLEKKRAEIGAVQNLCSLLFIISLKKFIFVLQLSLSHSRACVRKFVLTTLYSTSQLHS